MGKGTGTAAAAVCALALAAAPAEQAQADKLDDVINAGTLRCAVVLDFPPIGYRDENNEPAGFDVEYCSDLAAVLGVEHEIVEVTWAERLPAIVNGRADVIFGSTSDTLERAQTIGFSVPYLVFLQQTLVARDSGIEEWDDLADKRVGAAVSTYPEIEFLKMVEARGWDPDNYTSYQSESEVILAVAQGKIDAGITTNTVVKPIIEQHANLRAGPIMPITPDFCAVGADRKEYGWLNYLNLFVNQQVRSGRYEELWRKYVGTPPPSLVVQSVYR